MKETRELLKARFASVRHNLQEILDRLQDADLPWAPREGMHTVAGQLLEIANKEKETLVWVRTGVWPDEDPDAFDLETATREEIRAAMAALRGATYKYIDSLSDADLEQPIPNPNHWVEALRVTDCPLSEVLRGIAQHEYYHTGQLIVYLWVKGDNPDEW